MKCEDVLLRKWKEVPLVSAVLVAINVIIFIVCTFTGNLLYNMGGLEIEGVILRQEYWRILSAMFLHSDVNHIFNNMVILFFMGAMIEREIGHFRYGVFYFMSGLGGNVLSLLFKLLNREFVASVGASGAVFGLDGVLLALVLFSGKEMKDVTPGRVVLMIVYSLYSGFTGDSVDNAAHIGGLLTGFLLGIGMCIFDKWKTKKNGSERWSIEY